MTLNEWKKLTRILPTHPTTETGAVSVLVSLKAPSRPLLWNLEDYRVSSVSGVVVWLVPKN
jgi:hypothetical protein